MQLTLDVRQDIKRFLAIGGVSLALMIGNSGLANAAPAPNSDGDRDGLTYKQEVRVTDTSPKDPDTDNDGIKDGNEDVDEDGVDNTDEIKLGTKLGDEDSDDDGIEDGDEDKDSDGIEDEDAAAASADQCAPKVEDDADEDVVDDGIENDGGDGESDDEDQDD